MFSTSIFWLQEQYHFLLLGGDEMSEETNKLMGHVWVRLHCYCF